MKYIEYAHYDIASNETEIKDLLSKAIEYRPDEISVLPIHTKLTKSIVPHNIRIGTIIDFPFGIMDQKTRILSVENSIKNGSDIIQLVCPSYYLCNRKYDKFREDISKMREICGPANIEIRYVLEYRIFTLELLYKVAQILVSNDIKTIYPSTGHLLDNISDNILACGLISKKVDKLQIIANGNIWNESHINLLEKTSAIFGIKCHSINSLRQVSSIGHNKN